RDPRVPQRRGARLRERRRRAQPRTRPRRRGDPAVSGDDDRPGFLDREKKSFSELDRRRRDGRSRPEERRPTSPAQQARVEAAKKQYLKQIDGLFAKGKGGAEGERRPAGGGG